MILLLAVGVGMCALTLCVQAAPVMIFLHVATSKHPRSLLRPSFTANFILLQSVAAALLLAQLVNIALWAALFCLLGQFTEFDAAFYHSAVNYSSLGYGDIVMSQRWRLLGPLEAIDGIVMFGISTALIFALVQRLIEWRMKAQEPEMIALSPPSGDRT